VWTLLICHLRNIFTQQKTSNFRDKTCRRQSESGDYQIPALLQIAPQFYMRLDEKILACYKNPYVLIQLDIPGAGIVPTSFPAGLLMVAQMTCDILIKHRQDFDKKGLIKDSSPHRREIHRVNGRKYLIECCLWLNDSYGPLHAALKLITQNRFKLKAYGNI
jgi:hypothetical protein